MKRLRAAGSRATCGLALALALHATPAATQARAAAASSDHALQGAVDELAAWVAQRGGRLSASVVDVGSGAMLAGSHEQLALNPASNMKVLTAAAALDLLGPGYVYTTGLYGTVTGDTVSTLVLRGHGDPSLEVVDLLRLARALVATGARKVERIVVDQSRFDTAFVPPAFDQQPNEWAAFRAPVSAVALEQNTVTLNVEPGEPGQPARAWFEPPGFVDIEGQIATNPAGAGQDVRLTLMGSSPRLRARLGGHLAGGLPRMRFRRRVDDPRLFAGYVLAELLRELGLQVGDSVQLGGEGEKHLISYIESAPLSVLVRELGKASDNFYAETLLKTIGAETKGTPATSDSGIEAMLDWLKGIGLSARATQLRNGSGLFDANRVSAQTLTGVLRYAYRSPKIGPDFVAQLAIGGVDGTLRSRFRGARTRYRVRGKTGTLAKVIALSGYVLDPAGAQPAAFAFVVEGIAADQGELRRRIDACVERLSK